MNISQNAFIGVEGKYTWVDAEFEGSIIGVPVKIDAELDGIMGSFNLGFRF